MKRPESLMMSLGYEPKWSEGAVKPPIFQTSTFGFKTAEEGKRFFEIAYGKSSLEPGEQMGLIYSRLNNPNMQILEERLAALEGCETAAAFVSGMSAISTVMLTYLKPGDTLVFSNEVYGGTHHFVHHYLTSIGVNVHSVIDWNNPNTIFEELEHLKLTASVKLIYCETPANPTNTLVDLEKVAFLKELIETSSQNEVIMAVDNTYLGPLWQKPLEFGADLVCYSATKFLNGHSDVIAGAVMGSHKAVGPVKGLRTFLGGMIAPYTAWLLTRSLETLHVRMNYQTQNAEKIADFLVTHPKVRKVLFPGLASASDEQRLIYEKQCTAPGAMISIILKGGEAEAFRLLNALKLIKLAVSLGSNESLAQHPHSMTHSDVPDDQKEAMGIDKALVRISIGIEYAEDLIEDLKQALDTV